LAPHRLPSSSQVEGQVLWEYPTAIAPGFRLPFQAGICLRLGQSYANVQCSTWKWLAPRTPLTFLFHGADLTDFSEAGHPFWRQSPFFSMRMETRLERARALLRSLLENRQVLLTESLHPVPPVPAQKHPRWVAGGSPDPKA
jgi:hypothetical protein